MKNALTLVAVGLGAVALGMAWQNRKTLIPSKSANGNGNGNGATTTEEGEATAEELSSFGYDGYDRGMRRWVAPSAAYASAVGDACSGGGGYKGSNQGDACEVAGLKGTLTESTHVGSEGSCSCSIGGKALRRKSKRFGGGTPSPSVGYRSGRRIASRRAMRNLFGRG
jgi:hypothetical protein